MLRCCDRRHIKYHADTVGMMELVIERNAGYCLGAFVSKGVDAQPNGLQRFASRTSFGDC
jgi:hypothetical protein